MKIIIKKDSIAYEIICKMIEEKQRFKDYIQSGKPLKEYKKS